MTTRQPTSSIHALLEHVDADVRARLDAIGEFSITPDNLEAVRNRPLRTGGPLSDAVERSDHRAPGSVGDYSVPVRVHRPVGVTGALPCLYSIHGGGYMIGSNTGDDSLFDIWCQQFGCMGVSVEYRLAPEHPYPAPLEDCYAGLRWVHEHAEELGVDPSRVGIIGGSAGGGLAAGLALLARDRAEFPVALQILRYPMLDDRETASSGQADGPLWNPPTNRFAWRSYLGELDGSDAIPGYAVPARAADLSGLPPAFILLGALDILLDEGIAYARALLAAGVPTDLHVLTGAPHAFDSMLADTAVARRGRAMLDAWIAARL